MYKESYTDYNLPGVFTHWTTVKTEMEGDPTKVVSLPFLKQISIFGGDPTKARRITSRDAAQSAHTFKIRTENPKGNEMVRLLDVHTL